MKYGVWTQYFRHLLPEEAVIAFAKKGWHNLELSTEHGELLLSRGEPSRVGAEFKKFANCYGVNFPQGHMWLGVDIACENQDETVGILKQWLDLYHAIGIKACVLHAGGSWLRSNGKTEIEIDAANARALKLLCAHISGWDMLYICLENLSGSYRYAAELRRLINAVGSPQLKICLDTGHLNMVGGSQSEFIRESGSLLKALHITDNQGETDQHIMPYGRGNINWAEFTNALGSLDEPYDGLFNFEIPGETTAPYEVLMAKLDYLREMAGYMISQIK